MQKSRQGPEYLMEIKEAKPEGKKAAICELCGKGFSQASKLKGHVATVHKEKIPIVCEICGASFAQTIQLRGHMTSVHEGTKIFEFKKANQCQICNISYKYKKQLINHMSTVHEETNPYFCDICNKGFTAPENLR